MVVAAEGLLENKRKAFLQTADLHFSLLRQTYARELQWMRLSENFTEDYATRQVQEANKQVRWRLARVQFRRAKKQRPRCTFISVDRFVDQWDEKLCALVCQEFLRSMLAVTSRLSKAASFIALVRW